MKLKNINTDALVQKIQEASMEGKSEAIVQAMQALLDDAMSEQVTRYQEMASDVQANAAMAEKYGLRQLSSEEKDYYQKITTGAYSTEQDNLLPKTVLTYLYEDLKKSRPLFAHIDWAPAGLKKWIVGEKVGKSTWGALDSKITEEIKAELSTIDLEAHKLSAFSLVPLGVIELGFEWVDLFIRESLLEANEEGLEEGFIAGNGKDSPIGMLKDLDGSVTGGVYPDKPAVKLTDFTPAGLAEVVKSLSDDGKRTISKMILVVNASDQYTKIAPATVFLTATGEYRRVMPYDIEIIPSVAVPSGKAILTLPKAYTAGINRMGISTSDDFNFLDHLRTHKIVTYGNGIIKKNNMAVVLDITDIKPVAFNVAQDGKTGEGA
ncbi:phage major capsid protein [Erysipelothrix anatis]|uniref:phage major capsid protein n=1 Tax=Erysipelothrix anatis TaxID=2683713 RepID=UPI00135B5330|nr:phage major capsid protein [Erysipelothrix anatis]